MNKVLKNVSALLPLLVMGFAVAPAQADRVEQKSVSCWFVRGEKVEIKHKKGKMKPILLFYLIASLSTIAGLLPKYFQHEIHPN